MQRTLPEGYEAYDATQTARQAVPPPMEPVPPGAEGWEILAHGNDRKTPLVGDNSGIGSFVVNKKRLTMTLMRSSSPFYAWLLIGLFFITNACARQIVEPRGGRRRRSRLMLGSCQKSGSRDLLSHIASGCRTQETGCPGLFTSVHSREYPCPPSQAPAPCT